MASIRRNGIAQLSTIAAGLLLLVGPRTSIAQDDAEAAAKDEAIADIEPAVGSDALTSGIRRRQVNDGVIDELDLDATSITGNQELPKVLYIVPWKQADLGDLVGRPVNSLLDEVLAPIDRDVFQRQMTYYDSLYGEDPATDATAAQ